MLGGLAARTRSDRSTTCAPENASEQVPYVIQEACLDVARIELLCHGLCSGRKWSSFCWRQISRRFWRWDMKFGVRKWRIPRLKNLAWRAIPCQVLQDPEHGCYVAFRQ